jgi:hypothetical protein
LVSSCEAENAETMKVREILLGLLNGILFKHVQNFCPTRTPTVAASDFDTAGRLRHMLWWSCPRLASLWVKLGKLGSEIANNLIMKL